MWIELLIILKTFEYEKNIHWKLRQGGSPKFFKMSSVIQKSTLGEGGSGDGWNNN